MNRKLKSLCAAALIFALALMLTACSTQEDKHPLVAKWAETFDDGETKVMFSFEAIGDIEIYVFRPDDEGNLAQSQEILGSYIVNEENTAFTMTSELVDGEKHTAEMTFRYIIEDGKLHLNNDAYDFALIRVAENTSGTN